jgi:cytochrome c-type biogenesis protein CcmH
MSGLVVILLAMTAAAVAAIVWPFLSNGGAERPDSDVEVYRDQLRELESDREAGLISPEDAEAARLEVSRRLLGVVRNTKVTGGKTEANWRSGGRRIALSVTLIAVPAVSAAMYIRLGSPDLRAGGETRTAVSSPAESQTIESMIAQVEAHLRQNPNDGRGWEVLAPVYAKVGRYDDSVRA